MPAMNSVYAALSDPHRRQLLDRLREEGPLSLSALAEPMAMSRQAVTKHLNVLQRAGLVTVHRDGRERLHELVADPLREVEDWLAPYAAEWDARLSRLRDLVDGTEDFDAEKEDMNEEDTNETEAD